MSYTGVIQNSRTHDLNAISTALDAVFLTFMAYNPEQLGLTIPVYAMVRATVSGLLAYVRIVTTGPVGEK